MPSPVAHGLAGLAIAHFALRSGRLPNPGVDVPTRRAGSIFWTGALVFAANAPDLDFVPGILIGNAGRFHHGATHTLAAVLAFGLLAWGSARLAGLGSARRIGVVMALGFLSHLLFDWMTVETNGPYGMTLLWPLSWDRLSSPIQVFMEIRRDGRAGGFVQSLLQWHNVKAAVWELTLLGGLWAAWHAVSSVARALGSITLGKTPSDSEGIQ